MAHHDLKIHEQPFNDLLSGVKNCEVRNNGRGFQPGDTVQLHEIADTFTGRVMARKITHVQTGYGLPDGLCVLSYAQLPRQGGEAVAWREHSVNYAKGEKCPETIETLQAAWDRDQELINDMRHEIARHKTRINRLEQRRPVDQVADDLTMVKVSRELLERLYTSNSKYQFDPKTYWPAHEELRAMLAKSEGGSE